eukprot:5597960-Amphidinium_carterae.2
MEAFFFGNYSEAISFLHMIWRLQGLCSQDVSAGSPCKGGPPQRCCTTRFVAIILRCGRQPSILRDPEQSATRSAITVLQQSRASQASLTRTACH